MERLLMAELKAWKDKPDRKPLILRGARQVGKTWLLMEFGNIYFEDVCYVNFERNEAISNSFNDTLDPRRIIDDLSLFHGKSIKPHSTLIILDEIQEAPRALTALKYFAEEIPEYAICCAGSLLGIAQHEGVSFPVGKVHFLNLYPISFREFLLACGKEMLVKHIMKGNLSIESFNGELKNLLKTYMIIGGMPSAVSKWIETKDYFEVDQVLQNLTQAYYDDFSKHAPKNIIEKIRQVWKCIPSQLAKENKKFIFQLIRDGARAREYEDALMWLADMGLVYRSYSITKPGLPLSSFEDLKSFKIFMLDVGILRLLSGLSPLAILEGDRVFAEFKGALTEQYVMQELMMHKNLTVNHYWVSSGKAEVDFVFSDGLNIYPLEAKADINVRAKSLKVYDDLYHPKQIFIASLRSYHKNGHRTFIPLYLLFALKLT